MAGDPGGRFTFDDVNQALSDVNIQQQSLDEMQSTRTDVSQSPKRPVPPSLVIPRQGSVEYTHYEIILKMMKKYNTINDVPYHIKVEVEEILDCNKHDRSDWRGVASRLDIKRSLIEKMEQEHAPHPCKTVFEQASNRTVVSLLQVLYQMDRHDVLDIFHSHMIIKKEPEYVTSAEKRQKYKSSTYPSQETTPESAGTPSEKINYLSPGGSPCKGYHTPGETTPESADSGRGSSIGRCRSESNPIEHGDGHKQHISEESKSKVDFHSDVSKGVWKAIAPNGMVSTKTWKNFELYLRDKFHKESQQSQLLRFMCYVLKIGNYDERHNKYIKDQDFANMVAWFGPFEKDRCIEMMNKLMKHSVTHLTNTGSHSFFAGYMTKDEADSAVKDCENGTFIIRFSSTNAIKGSFAVVLKTPHGPEHHEIKQHGSQPTGKLIFDGKMYNGLVQLHTSRLCRGGVSTDGRTSCTITCRDLPLNAMFKQYLSGPVPNMGRPRGRGRGAPPHT